MSINTGSALMNSAGRRGRCQTYACALFLSISITCYAEDVTTESVGQSSANESEVESDKITVIGRPIGSYSVFDASTATKTETPILEIPQSIQVIPQQIIRDLQAVSLGEVLENISGIQDSGTDRTGLTSKYTVRGFPLDKLSNFYKNGRPFVFSVPPPNEVLERVEFLKGPASVLYGQSEPGGIVNMVLKKPTAQQQTIVNLQGGTYDYYRAHVDTGGPLTDSAGYRVNVSHTDSDTFRDFHQFTQSVAAVALSWDPSPNFQFSLNGQYQLREQPADSGLAAGPGGTAGQNNRPLKVKISRFLNEPWTNVDAETREIGYDLKYLFSNHWQLRHSGNAQWQYTDELRADPQSVQNDGGVTKTLRDREIDRRTVYAEASLLGEYDIGNVNHKLLFGADYVESISGFTEANPDVQSIRSSDFNVFDPVYTDAPPDSLGDEIFLLSRNTLDQTGLYYQGQHGYDDWVHLLLGVRYDTFLNKLERSGIFNNNFVLLDQDLSDVSYRTGVLLEPWEDTSLFVSYSQSFRPNIDPFAQEILDPQQGEQWELGIKMALLDGFLMTTLTAFDLTKTNVIIVNPVSQTLSIAGERVARGIELDVIGELAPGWNTVINYAYLDAEITKGDPRPLGTPGRPASVDDITGKTPPNSPSHSARLWLTYQFQSPDLLGWRVGAGGFARSQVQATNDNDLQLPGFGRLDAMIGWSGSLYGNDVDAQINVKNVLNKVYYTGSNRNFIKPNDPFMVFVQLAFRF